MKRLFFSIIILFFSESFSQTVIVDDGFEINFKKAVTNARWLHSSSVYFVVPSENEKRIQVRYRVRSVSGSREPFDPNKFYLLSEEYKARFQTVDVKYNAILHQYNTFGMIAENSESENKISYLDYNSNYENSFRKYQKEGYKDIKNCLNFGTKRNPKLECMYFAEKKIRSNIIDTYFILPLDFKEGIIFYGNQKIAEIKVK